MHVAGASSMAATWFWFHARIRAGKFGKSDTLETPTLSAKLPQ